MIFALATTACNYRVVKQTPAPTVRGSLPNQNSGETAFVDAKTMEMSVLVSCKNCHHTGAKTPPLANADDFRAHFAGILKATAGDSMPPASQGYVALSACQKAVLHKWDELGKPNSSVVEVSSLAECAGESSAPGAPSSAPNSPPAPGPTAPATPSGSPAPTSITAMPLTYQTFYTQILQPKCLGCHSESSDDEDANEILFFPYPQIKAKANLFAAPSTTSRFIHFLTRTDGRQMPPPDSTKTPITAEEVAWVAKWIDAGTPEN